MFTSDMRSGFTMDMFENWRVILKSKGFNVENDRKRSSNDMDTNTGGSQVDHVPQAMGSSPPSGQVCAGVNHGPDNSSSPSLRRRSPHLSDRENNNPRSNENSKTSNSNGLMQSNNDQQNNATNHKSMTHDNPPCDDNKPIVMNPTQQSAEEQQSSSGGGSRRHSSQGSNAPSHRSGSAGLEQPPSPVGVHSQPPSAQIKRSSSDPNVILNNPDGDTPNNNSREPLPKGGSLVFKFDAKTENISFSAIAENEGSQEGCDEDGEERSNIASSCSREGSADIESHCSGLESSVGEKPLNVQMGTSPFPNSSYNNNKSAVKAVSADKKKKGYWYNVLSPTYKSRSEDFKRIFKDIPDTERLIVDYSCALQKDILVHGRLYITQGWICFYANIFRWETVLTIRCKDVTAITKEKTARVIPNAIQVATGAGDKFFFTSFGARDKSFLMLFRVWQNALVDNQMSSQELWSWVHLCYGDELGLTSSDDDYNPPSQEEKRLFELDQDQRFFGTCDKEPADDDTFLNGEVESLNNRQSQADSVSTTTDASVRNDPAPPVPSRKRGTKPPSSLEVVATPSIASNGDLPTDMGDTTEDDGDMGEVQCTGHEHNGFTALDDIFYIPVDRMYELLFTDSQMYKDFIAARKTYDLVLGPWSEDGIDRVRNISYTLSLNYSIGPKCSPSTEKQTYFGAYSKPGAVYIVDTEVVNGGVPYSDNFYVVNRYCLTRVNSKKSRLVITSQIKFRTKAWGLVKKLITKTAREGLEQNFQLLDFVEKNATAGILEAYNSLGEFLHKEGERQTTSGQTSKKKIGRKRRKAADRQASVKQRSVSETQPTKTAPVVKGAPTGPDSVHINFNVDVLVRIICIVLILLVFFNAVLFYKLWSLEQQAGLLSHKYYHSTAFQHPPQNSQDWQKLLDQQEHLHEAEIDRWKEILSSSITLMDHMKRTLAEVMESLDRRSMYLQKTHTENNTE